MDSTGWKPKTEFTQAGICPFCYTQIIVKEKDPTTAKIMFAIEAKNHMDNCKERMKGR